MNAWWVVLSVPGVTATVIPHTGSIASASAGIAAGECAHATSSATYRWGSLGSAFGAGPYTRDGAVASQRGRLVQVFLR